MTGSAEHERIEAVRAKTTFDEIENLGTFSRLVNRPNLAYMFGCRCVPPGRTPEQTSDQV